VIKVFYQAYIQGNMVKEIETSDSGMLMVRLCPLGLGRTDDAAYDHQVGFFTPMNVSENQEDVGGCIISAQCVMQLKVVLIIRAPNFVQRKKAAIA
jgi:hypothetical protein